MHWKVNIVFLIGVELRKECGPNSAEDHDKSNIPTTFKTNITSELLLVYKAQTHKCVTASLYFCHYDSGSFANFWLKISVLNLQNVLVLIIVGQKLDVSKEMKCSGYNALIQCLLPLRYGNNKLTIHHSAMYVRKCAWTISSNVNEYCL